MGKEEKIKTKEEIVYTFELVPDVENAPRRIYVNGAFIHHSNFDFTINFYEFIPPLEHEVKRLDYDETGKVNIIVPVVARIGMNFDLVPRLIRALEENYKRYLDEQKKLGEKQNASNTRK